MQLATYAPRSSPAIARCADGKKFQDEIRTFVGNYTYLTQTLVPFCATAQGGAYLSALVDANAAAYPDYVDEIRGIAAGSGVDISLLFMLMFEDELGTFVEAGDVSRGADACSDVHLNSAGATILGHNEDSYYAVGEGIVLMDATIEANERHEEYSFVALQYPGYLPGVAFGFNSHHIAISCNGLFPVQASPTGLGSSWIARDLLGSVSLADAIGRARVQAPACGHSFNLLSFRSEDAQTHVLTNIEIYTNGSTMLQIYAGESQPPLVDEGVFFHFNMYRHTDVAQYPDISSIARLNTAQAMPLPVSLDGVLAIIGSTLNSSYPIYRNGAPPDTGLYTIASAVFNLEAGTMSVFFENPALSQPAYVFDVHRHHHDRHHAPQ